MNRKILLIDGEQLEYEVWQFWETGMNCHTGCCLDIFENIEETLDTIEHYCDGEWEEVKVV